MEMIERPNPVRLVMDALASRKFILTVTFGVCMYLLGGSMLLVQDLKKVVIGVTTLNSINVFPLIIAREFGYFKARSST